MKTFTLLLIFSLSSLSKSIDERSIKTLGYWPIADFYSQAAMMPIKNKKIIIDDMGNDDIQPAFNPQAEIFVAILSGTIALTPHFLIGYSF